MSQTDDFNDRTIAARYALGVASLSEINSAEARIEIDPVFAAHVAFYDTIFTTLENSPASVEPPAGLWNQIEAAIDDNEKLPATRTVRLDQVAWEAFAPGIDRKIVHVDKANAIQIALYRLAPNATVPPHDHCATEECLVLEGEVEVDGVVMRKGDVHLAFPLARHQSVISRTGAILYARLDLQLKR